MTSSNGDITTLLDPTASRFVLWALATLRMEPEDLGNRQMVLQLPEEHRAAFGGRESVVMEFAADDRPGKSPSGAAKMESSFFRWLIEQLNNTAVHAVPVDQPVSVHELSPKLFAAYTIDGGSINLGGCTLEDHPVLRVSWVEEHLDHHPQIAHFFAGTDGHELPQSLVDELELSELVPPELDVPVLPDEQLDQWISAALKIHHQESGETSAPRQRESVAATVIWCKHAAGKLSFMIGDATAEVSFSGWAKRLLNGSLLPPPFKCPVTEVESYHLAAADDGRISAYEAIVTCAESGTRVLCTEVDECSATGKAVLPAYLDRCPVTGDRILPAAMVVCEMCHQSVAPRAIEAGICSACHSLATVSKNDPRMARVLGEYPKLDRWNRWQIAETSTAYVLTAAAFVRRLLVVVNKESLELLRLATRNRFSTTWAEAPIAERNEYLN